MIEKVSVKYQPYVSVTVTGADGWERRFLDECQYASTAIMARRNRDMSSLHHVTVADWKEARKHEVAVPDRVSFEAHGIGHVTDENGNEAWFVVVTSPELTEARTAAGLPPKDFHITLGFIGKDVHGVPKNLDTIVSWS